MERYLDSYVYEHRASPIADGGGVVVLNLSSKLTSRILVAVALCSAGLCCEKPVEASRNTCASFHVKERPFSDTE
jgi:hypothetical protein